MILNLHLSRTIVAVSVFAAALSMACASSSVQASCKPNWHCTSWSACSYGKKTRTCTDTKKCGVTTGEPETNQSCTCKASWSCAKWSSCAKGATTQTRTCKDRNAKSCVPSTNEPPTSQACPQAKKPACTPQWSCGAWGGCSGGSQIRSCTDAQRCGTTSGEPATSQGCTEPVTSTPSCLKIDIPSPNADFDEQDIVGQYYLQSGGYYQSGDYCISNQGLWEVTGCPPWTAGGGLDFTSTSGSAFAPYWLGHGVYNGDGMSVSDCTEQGTCKSNSNCSATAPYCQNGSCVACLTDGQYDSKCPSSAHLCHNHQCVQCTQNTDCYQLGKDTCSNGTCTQSPSCNSDAGCTAPQVCNTLTHKCVGCVEVTKAWCAANKNQALSCQGIATTTGAATNHDPGCASGSWCGVDQVCHKTCTSADSAPSFSTSTTCPLLQPYCFSGRCWVSKPVQ